MTSPSIPPDDGMNDLRSAVAGVYQDPATPPTPQLVAPKEGVEYWSGVIQAGKASELEQFGTSMRAAIKANPETAGLADSLARKMGMPLLKAQDDMGFLRAVSVMQRMRDDNIRSTSPVLYKSFQGLEFARKALDDYDALSWGESWARGWKSGGLTAERGRLAAKLWLSGGLEWDQATKQYKRNATDRMQRREDLTRLEQIGVEQSEIGPIGGFIGNAAQIAGQWADAVPRAVESGYKTAAVTGAASLLAGPASPVATPAATVGGFAFGFSAQYTADTFASMTGNAYADMVAAGYDPDRALVASVAYGIAGTALELGGLNIATSAVRQKIMGAVWKRAATEVATDVPSGFVRGYLGEYGKVIAAETGTELAQEFGLIVAEQLARRGGEDDMNPNGVASRLWEVASATVQGMALLGVPGGVAGGFKGRVAAFQKLEQDRAQAQRDHLKAAQGINPKMLERDPEAAADFMRQALRQGDGPQEAHLDAETFRTLLDKIDTEGAKSGVLRKSTLDVLEGIVPGISKQLEDAEATGGDVSLPVADIITRIRGELPEFELAFSEVARLDPQAPDAEQQTSQDTEKAASEADTGSKDEAAFYTSLKEIERQTAPSVAEATAGGKVTANQARFVARAYSAMVEQIAREENLTPEKAVEKFGIKEWLSVEEIPGDALSQFAGPKAKGAPRSALQKAYELLDAGTDASEVFQATGWSVSPTGKLRFEIADDAAKLLSRDGETLAEVLDHPALFKAYPQLGLVPVRFSSSLGDGIAGEFRPPDGVIGWKPSRARIGVSRSLSDESVLSVLLHEVQHAIQSIEGDYRGDTKTWWANPLEAEARNVQARAALTKGQRRQSDPSSTEDVPREMLAKNERGMAADDIAAAEQSAKEARRTLVADAAKKPDAIEADPNILRQPGRGGFDLQRMAVMFTSGADVSTVLHELTHWFVEVVERLDAAGSAYGKAQLDNLLAHWKMTREQWAAMDLEQRRPLLEDIAYNAEDYFASGQAPSAELRGVFNKLRSFIVGIYGAVRSYLVGAYAEETGGAQLRAISPELRSFFDRMLAADSAIEIETATRQGAARLSDEAAKAIGIDAETLAEIRAKEQEVVEDAKEALTSEAVRAGRFFAAGRRNAEASVKRKLAESTARVRRQVEKEVAEAPVYRAIDFIRNGEVADDAGVMHSAKLDTDSVRGIFGDDAKLDAYYAEKEAVRQQAEKEAVAKAGEIAKARAGSVAEQAAENSSTLRRERSAEEQRAWDQANEEVLAKPVHQAIKFMAYGTVNDNGKVKPAKMDRSAVRVLAGKTSLGKAQEVFDKIPANVIRKDGASPDVIAAQFGFPNALTLIEEVAKANFDKEVEQAYRKIRKASGLFDKSIDSAAVRMAAEETVASPAAAKAAFAAGASAARAAGRISRPELVADLIRDLTRKDGTNPDLMARSFGFESGGAMLRAIINAPSKEAAIAAQVQQRLEAEEPLSNPKEFKRAVEDALHGKSAARLASTILRAMLGDGVKSSPQLEAEAREAARLVILRTPVGRISVRSFANAELRAMRARDKAIKSGDKAAAIEAMRRYLVQHYLTVEGAKAEREIERETATIAKRFEQPVDKLKDGRNLDVVQVAIAMLGKFGMVSAARHNAAVEYLSEWARLDTNGYKPYAVRMGMLVEAAVPMEQMTLDRFRVVTEAASGFWSEAKQSNYVRSRGKLVLKQQAQSELLDEVVDTFGKEDGSLPDFRPEEMTDWSMGAILANLTRLEAWTIKMDGGEPGAWHRYVYQPLKDAAVSNEVEKITQHKWAADIMARHDAIKPLAGEEIDLQPVLGQGRNAVFKNRGEFLGALQHIGTEKGLRNLIIGNKLGTQPMPGSTYDEQFAAALPRFKAALQYAADKGWLFEADFKLLQEQWNHIGETLKDRLFTTTRDVWGFYPTEEKAQPFETPFGTIPGGYFPSKVDKRKSTITADKQLSAIEQGAQDFRAAHASVPRGMTIKRGENVVQPRVTDIRLLTQHIDEALNIIHLQPALSDVAGLFRGNVRSNEQLGMLREAMAQVAPFAERKIILPALERMARDSIVAPGDAGLAKTIGYVRQSTSMGFLGFNPKNAALQFTGLANAVPQVGMGRLWGAFWSNWASPSKLVASIEEQSDAMRARWSAELQLLAQDMDRMLEPSALNDVRRQAAKAAFFLQRYAQMTVDALVWQAAHDKATAEGSTADDAVTKADSAVRITQGEKSPLDVSQFLAGGAVAQLFTQFADYPNTVLNQNLAAPEGRRFAVFAWTVIAPALATSMIGWTLAFGKLTKGERDDDEYGRELLNHFVGDQVRGAFGLLPVAGPIIGSALNELFGLTNTPGGMRNTPFAGWSMVDTIYRIGSGRGGWSDWIMGAGLGLRLPVRPAASIARYEQNVAAGREEDGGALDYLRVLLVGR